MICCFLIFFGQESCEWIICLWHTEEFSLIHLLHSTYKFVSRSGTYVTVWEDVTQLEDALQRIWCAELLSKHSGSLSSFLRRVRIRSGTCCRNSSGDMLCTCWWFDVWVLSDFRAYRIQNASFMWAFESASIFSSWFTIPHESRSTSEIRWRNNYSQCGAAGWSVIRSLSKKLIH